MNTQIATDLNGNQTLIMPTVIARTSTDRVKRLLRTEFDSLNQVWQEQERKDIIKTAKDYGLFDLANEMQNDL